MKNSIFLALYLLGLSGGYVYAQPLPVEDEMLWGVASDDEEAYDEQLDLFAQLLADFPPDLLDMVIFHKPNLAELKFDEFLGVLARLPHAIDIAAWLLDQYDSIKAAQRFQSADEKHEL